MKQSIFAALAVLLTAAGSVDARETSAHVHGAARMQVAVEGNTLELELISPLDSLLGFEHAPRNEQQRKSVQAMSEKFRKPETLIVPTAAARCTSGPAHVTSPFTDASNSKQEDSHAELEAVITFQCASPSALKGLEVRLFEAFPHLHRLQVQMVGPRGQSASTLTPKRRALSW
ncbi:MAG: hypothetical protein JWM42_401 [Burkholderia sp.]|nr:hypothetical protein [Burkholderia sp.]